MYDTYGWCVICDARTDNCVHVRNLIKQTRKDFATHIADKIIKTIKDDNEKKREYLKMIHKEMIQFNDPQRRFKARKKGGRPPRRK